MMQFHPAIKLVHVACVIASGSLFALRGVLVLGGSRAGNHGALRGLSYAIDTALLTAALMLVAILHVNPAQQPWLAVKLVLLPVYIVLGIFALRRARTVRGRALCFIAALAVFLYMAGAARMHSAWSWLAALT
jgi:uncharacterized membrane protein SirB2